MNLGSGQSLEDPHRPTTVRAEPQRGFFLVRGWRCVWLELSWGHGAEGLEAKRQQGRPLAVGEEAEVTNADEAFGEQVQQEAAQELIQRQGHQFLLIVVSRVAPAKGNLAIGKRDESMVGDGDAVGVAAQILEHIRGASEGRLAVDHPVVSVEGSQPGSEDLGLSQGGEFAIEAELAALEGGAEGEDKLAAKHAPEHGAGKKEARAAGDPVGVIE